MSLKQSAKTPDMILKLSHLLRYMLYESQQEFVPLDKELQMLRAYIDLETMRLKDKNAIQITIDKEAEQGTIAPALLIFFVENAVKHGIETMPVGGFISIKMNRHQDTQLLHFQCINNFDDSSNIVRINEKNNGIGLSNVAKRLELIYPNTHELTITNTKHIFEVNLYLKTFIHDLPNNR